MQAITEKRKASGRVREGHGDLHLGNILTIHQHVEIFDCIEFAPTLRYIDVMNDLAFVIMDLSFNEQPAFSMRLLNSYLEKTGDFEGLTALPYYSVHRAMVRGKVALLRADELGGKTTRYADAVTEGMKYIAFAGALTQTKKRSAVVIMHGYAGSGKTWVAQRVAQTLGAVHLRSDVERKRLSGLNASERGSADLYTSSMTKETYHRLLNLTETIVAAGWPVIVDAAFLQAWQRALFREFAARSGCSFLIMALTASPTTLRSRIEARVRNDTDASDADAAVLEGQFNTAEPLSEIEMVQQVRIDMDVNITEKTVVALCEPLRKAISGAPCSGGQT
jgi:predicted kinase